jgi:5-methylcytosine-specific restriction endonuclease McrA
VATEWQAANSQAYDDTGARMPALDERSDVRHMSTPVVASDACPRSASGDSQPTPSVPPLAELRYKVQFTADQAYVDLLEEAHILLQHQLPTRDLVEVQRRALELLVHKLRQRKYAASGRPRPKAPEPVKDNPQPKPKSVPARAPAPQSSTQPHRSAPQSANQSRYIPAEVRRGVWHRDEARCAYVDARGKRCREQAGLEFHHQHPHGRGGPPTIDNLALRCRSHNTLAAEQDFGRDLIRKRRTRRATLAEPDRAGAAP